MKKSQGVGQVLRWLRKERSLRQLDVAKRAGVAASQVTKWENETQGLRFESLVEVLDALGVTMGEFGELFDRAKRGESLEAAVEAEHRRSLGAAGKPAKVRPVKAFMVLLDEEVAASEEEEVDAETWTALEASAREILKVARPQLRQPEEVEPSEGRKDKKEKANGEEGC